MNAVDYLISLLKTPFFRKKTCFNYFFAYFSCSESSDLNEYISNWLESSQTDDDDDDHDDHDDVNSMNHEDAEHHQLIDHSNKPVDSFDDNIHNNIQLSSTTCIQHTQESIHLKSFVTHNNNNTNSSSIKTKSINNSFTTISSTSLEYLCHLASSIEEFDTWVPTSEQLNQLFNNIEYSKEIHSTLNVTNIEPIEQLNTHHNDDDDDDEGWTCSSIDSSKHRTIDNNVTNTTLTSQHPSIIHSSHIIDLDNENENTLLYNATQCALSFVCSQQSLGVDQSIVDNLLAIKNEQVDHDNDDKCMSQLVGNDLHTAAAADDDDAVSRTRRHHASSNDMFISMEDLEPVREIDDEVDDDDEESCDDLLFDLHSTPLPNAIINESVCNVRNDECTLSDSLTILSPLHQSMEDLLSKDIVKSCQMDSISDIFFDSWSSGSDTTSKSDPNIPQVDGNMDTSHTDSDNDHRRSKPSSCSLNTTVHRVVGKLKHPKKRRRLSLRLPRRQDSPTQTMCTTTSTISPHCSLNDDFNKDNSSNNTDSIYLSLNKSTPIVKRKSSVTQENVLCSRHNNTTSSNSSTVINNSVLINTNLPNPVVLLERLPSSVDTTQTSSCPNESGRLTPPEEFLDLQNTLVTDCGEIETSSKLNDDSSSMIVLSEQQEQPPLFSSFHYDEFSDLTCSPCSCSAVCTDKLSLYSQTQISSPLTDVNRLSVIPPEEQEESPQQSSSTLFTCIPFWRPTCTPPKLNDVNNWLKQSNCNKKHSTIVKTNDPCTDLQSKLNHENDKVIQLTTELFPQQCTSGHLIASTMNDEQNSNNNNNNNNNNRANVDDNQTLLLLPQHASTNNDLSFDTTRQSMNSSVSVLYQAANERCFSSVQIDHTTIASLELHCSSRLTKSHTLSNLNESNIKLKSIKTNSLLKCGLMPDPLYDSIQIACLTVQRPIQSSIDDHDNGDDADHTLHHHHHQIDLFVLIHSELSNTKQCMNKFLHGLSNYRYKIHKSRQIMPRIIWCSTEWNLISWIVYFIQTFDPEILIGYDIERFSWGYLVERANQLGRRTITRELSRLASDIINCPHCHQCIDACIRIVQTPPPPITTSSTTSTTNNCNISSNMINAKNNLWHFNTQEFMNNLDQLLLLVCHCPCNPLYNSTMTTTVTNKQSNNPTINYRRVWPCDSSAGRTGGPFACPGRVVLCFWRILMHEISLYEYSVETVVYHLLKEFMPRYTFAQLNEWYANVNGTNNRWRTIDYWIHRSMVNLKLLNTLDLIGRTSEFARIFGIEFYHVLSRGSQYRVESLLCRIAKQSNFLLPSPSVTQRAHQRAPEGIPLNLEPESTIFIDGPVAVLDFQSLYPSVIIAYNYCYSTLLGRLSCLLESGEDAVFNLGCLSHSLPSGLINIYYPCLLEAKKRYVGYAYETVEQTEPIFDAKGIETVRRDSCPFVGQILEDCFKLLFNHFTMPNTVNMNNTEINLHKDEDNQSYYKNLNTQLKLAENHLKLKIQQFAYRLIHGKIPLNQCIITRPFWGMSSYKPGTYAPALQVAKRLLSMDPRGEPLRGERVVYYIAAGRSDQTLLSCVRSINEIYPSLWMTTTTDKSTNSSSTSSSSRRLLGPRLNYAYYLDKQFIPPIERMTQVIGWPVRSWLSELPRYFTSKYHRYILTSRPTTGQLHSTRSRQHPFTANRNSPAFSPSSFILSPQSLSSSSQMNCRSRSRTRSSSSLMRAFIGQPPRICPNCLTIVPNISSTNELGHCRTCLHGNARLMNIEMVKFGCQVD
ncbi:unnamed protein product [Schistosoma turkestanicum]|nr:unnamed protein product [Schistosoma turkestanicum]